MPTPTWRLLAAATFATPLLMACGTRDERPTNDSAAGTVAMADSVGMSATGTMNDGAVDASLVSFAAMVNQAEIEAGQLASAQARNSEVKQYAKDMVQGHQRAMEELRELGGRSGWPIQDPGSGGATLGTGNNQGASGAGSASGNSTAGNSATGAAGGTGGTGAMGSSGAAGTTGAAGGAGTAGTGTGTGDGMLASIMTQMQQSHAQMMTTLSTAKGATFDRAYMDSQIAAHQQTLDVLRQHGTSVQNTELRDKMNAMQQDVEAHLRRAQEIAQKLGNGS